MAVRRRPLALVLAFVAVSVVALVVLFVVPVPTASGSGSITMTQRSEGGWAAGAASFAPSSSGAVSVSWSAVQGEEVVVAVVPGVCSTWTCFNETDTEPGAFVCWSPSSTTTATSGTCSFSGGSGDYSILAASTSGFQTGDSITYTVSVAHPLL